MPAAQVREILQRLADGEITQDEAEANLDALTADAHEEPSGAGVRVRARLNAGGTIVIEGSETETPRVDGPNRCRTHRVGDTYDVEGQMGDDAALIVPADADVELHLSCGNVEITGLRGTLEAHVNAGDVVFTGELSRGSSHVVANAGGVFVALDRNSSVRVIVRAPTSVEADPEFRKTGRGEWTLEEGAATLEIDGNLGTIHLRVA